jgi:hypothetical protein
VLGGLTHLGRRPSFELLRSALARGEALLPEMSPNDLLQLVYALSKLQVRNHHCLVQAVPFVMFVQRGLQQC